MASKLTCESLLLADTVIRDATNHKLSLIGCFSSLFPAAFPTRVHRFSVVAFVGDVSAPKIVLTTSVALRGKEREPIATCELTLERLKMPNPKFFIGGIDAVFPFENVIFPKAGFYDITLRSGEKTIAKRTISANSRTAENPPK